VSRCHVTSSWKKLTLKNNIPTILDCHYKCRSTLYHGDIYKRGFTLMLRTGGHSYRFHVHSSLVQYHALNTKKMRNEKIGFVNVVPEVHAPTTTTFFPAWSNARLCWDEWKYCPLNLFYMTQYAGHTSQMLLPKQAHLQVRGTGMIYNSLQQNL